MNPIEHYFEYGVNENLDFEPGDGVTPPAEYNDITLTSEQAVWEGTAGNDNFIADVTASQRTSTLASDTSIDGGAGQDRLTVAMDGNFRGFGSEGGLANINEVVLNSTGKGTRSFNADGIEGVDTWTLNDSRGVVNLSNLSETGVTVNVADLAGKSATTIGFANDVADGASDAMTLGLDSVGTAARGSTPATHAKINMAGIEDVTVEATGDNFANLAGVSAAETLTITGKGNLSVNDVAAGLETVAAGDAEGNLALNLASATDFQNATLGAGNDKLTVSNIEETSVIDGGAGDDTLTMVGVAGRYQPIMSDMETLVLDQKAGAPVDPLTLAGSEIAGLENLVVKGLDKGENILLAEYSASELNVRTEGNNSGTVEIADIDQINMTVGNSKAEEKFDGTLILDGATGLNLNVGNTTERGDVFGGDVVADELENLSIFANRNNAANSSNPTVVLGSGSSLENVSDVTVNGFGAVDLRGYSNLGANAADLNVDASGLNAKFHAAFNGSANSESITVAGSALQDNAILINGSNYKSVNITGGLGKDRITLTGDGAGVELTGELGRDDEIVIDGGATNWNVSEIAQALGIAASQITQLNPGETPADVVNGGEYLAPQGSTQSVTANTTGKTDLSGLTYENGEGTTAVTAGDGAEVILPSSGNVVATANNLSDSAGIANLTLTAAPNAGETQTVQIDQVGKSYSNSATLTFTNDGAGEVVLSTGVEDTVTDPRGNVATINVFKQTRLDLTVSDPEGSIVAFGRNLNDTGEGGAVNSNIMANVHEINLDGAGDINFSAQIGTKDNDSITVEAGDMTGDISGMALYAKVINVNLGSGDDAIQVTPYKHNGGSVVNAGAGADFITLSWAYGGKLNNNVINVDLGDDSDADTLRLYSAFESSETNPSVTDQGSAFVQVENFNVGQDTVVTGSTGTTRLNRFVETTKDVWDAAIKTYTGAASVSVTGVDGDNTAGVVFYNGNAYLMAQGGGNSGGWGTALTAGDFSTNVKENVCIVELQGVTSGTFAQITGADAAA